MLSGRLVIGTFNRKKGRELVELAAREGFASATLGDVSQAEEVDETGATFAENAVLKAQGYALTLGEWVLADDSGLVVEALGGGPGVLSARYAGQPASDDANNARLLAELAEVPLEKRGAAYVCHVAVADPTGIVRVQVEETCRGRIAFAPRGTGGFGYDPLFEIPEYRRTFGEFGPDTKACLSHRARAARRVFPLVRRIWPA
jgi:XTP/dITP diphosphohydrolase